MDALLLLALGSLALLGLFAVPALADHVHEHHRALRTFAVRAPRPAANPVVAPRAETKSEEAGADGDASSPSTEPHDGQGQPSDYVGNTGDDPSDDAA